MLSLFKENLTVDAVFCLFLMDIQRLSPNAVRSETPLNSKEYKTSLFVTISTCGMTTDMATSASKPFGTIGFSIFMLIKKTLTTLLYNAYVGLPFVFGVSTIKLCFYNCIGIQLFPVSMLGACPIFKMKMFVLS